MGIQVAEFAVRANAAQGRLPLLEQLEDGVGGLRVSHRQRHGHLGPHLATRQPQHASWRPRLTGRPCWRRQAPLSPGRPRRFRRRSPTPVHPGQPRNTLSPPRRRRCHGAIAGAGPRRPAGNVQPGESKEGAKGPTARGHQPASKERQARRQRGLAPGRAVRCPIPPASAAPLPPPRVRTPRRHDGTDWVRRA